MKVNSTRMLQTIDEESTAVSSFFQSLNLNSSAFSELDDLMSSLGADDVELEEYFTILFTNTQAVDLLAASVGDDADAQQDVIDALDGNQQVWSLVSSHSSLIQSSSLLMCLPTLLRVVLEERGGRDKQR